MKLGLQNALLVVIRTSFHKKQPTWWTNTTGLNDLVQSPQELAFFLLHVSSDSRTGRSPISFNEQQRFLGPKLQINDAHLHFDEVTGIDCPPRLLLWQCQWRHHF